MDLSEAIHIVGRSRKCGSPYQRFLSRCYPLGNGCVGFRGHHDKDGYPKFAFAGRQRPASHAALACVGITVAEGMQANHHCDNRQCVNPEHLFLGSQDDNVKDMMAKGRHAQGERHSISKLTEEAVRDIRANCIRRGDPKLYAAKYGVKIGAVWAARNRQNWKHIDA